VTSIECRLIHDYEDFEKIVDLEIAVWDLDARDAVPANLMHAMATNGNLVVGAYDRNQIIGMALAFPAQKNGKWILWSHMAAVHPNCQNQGVGFLLKQFQRTWALERNYPIIGWTFDPLQRGNANFNLNRLGAISNIYHVNFYGEMRDGINAGLPSDRLEVHWYLRQKRVANLAQSTMLPPISNIEAPILLKSTEYRAPVVEKPNWNDKAYFVEIPSDLRNLKQTNPHLALEWRLALRHALVVAFERGYTASDFVERDGKHYYILTCSESWFLYVLKCADTTLYTGITPNIPQRLKRHNQGKGAAYTASRRPVELLGGWRFPNRASATRAESQFKKLSRQNKLNYIQQQIPYENAPFVANHDVFGSGD